MKTKTPRTDAQLKEHHPWKGGSVAATFARQLETELADMTARKDNAYQTIQEMKDAAFGPFFAPGKMQCETIGQIKRMRAQLDEYMTLPSAKRTAKPKAKR